MKPRLSLSLVSLLVCGACGDNSDSTPDAPLMMPDSGIPDAAADAMPDGGPPGPMARVTVRFRGAPKQGAFVAFHDAAGTPIGFATTAADGSAEGEIVVGGIITVGVSETVGPQTNHHLVSIYAVDEDDDLLVEILRPQGSGTIPVIARWTLFGGAVSYQAAFCPNQYFVDPFPNPPELNLSDQVYNVPSDCLDSNNEATLMFVAKDGASGSGDILAFGGVKGVAANEVYNPPVVLEAKDTRVVQWANLPSQIGGNLISPSVLSFWYTNGIGVGNGYSAAPDSIGGSNPTGSMDVPGGSFANFYDFAINGYIAALSFTPRTIEVGVRMQGTFPGPLTADMSEALPGIDTVTIDYSALPALQSAWTTVSPLTGADGGRLQIGSQTLNDVGWSWEVTVPASATSVVFPTLPEEMAAFEPPDDGRTFQVSDIFMLEHSDAAGYADIRTDWFRYFSLDPRGTQTLRFSESSQ